MKDFKTLNEQIMNDKDLDIKKASTACTVFAFAFCEINKN